MAIDIHKDVQTAAVASIQRFFEERMDNRIGNLEARSLLDFFIKELAPSIYNQAIADAQAHLQAKVLDLDVDCHEQEFGYWKTAARPSR